MFSILFNDHRIETNCINVSQVKEVVDNCLKYIEYEKGELERKNIFVQIYTKSGHLISQRTYIPEFYGIDINENPIKIKDIGYFSDWLDVQSIN